MAKGTCPFCDTVITVSKKMKAGAKVICPQCEEILRLVSIKPVRFEFFNDSYGFEARYAEEIEESERFTEENWKNDSTSRYRRPRGESPISYNEDGGYDSES